MKTVTVIINGRSRQVCADISVAAAIAQAGEPFRCASDGRRRAPLCGMGACFECRVGIDGRAQQRACMVPVREGMRVDTDD